MMARQSVDREALKGGSPRERLWRAIRALKTFDLNTLLDRSKVNKATARTYLECLTAAGQVKLAGTRPATRMRSNSLAKPQDAKLYTLVRDTGAEAPRLKRDGHPVLAGRARENMWRTMKMLGKFTVLDLAAAATTEKVLVSEIDAKDYARHLALAGYLAIDGSGRRAAGRNPAGATYVFLNSRFTGPKPPMVQRTKCVFDPNLRRIVWHPEIDA